MKVLFILFFLIVLAVPYNFVLSADEFWCVCGSNNETCKSYTTQADLDAKCTGSCLKQKTKPVSCQTPASGSTSSTPASSNPNLQTVKLDNPIGANAGTDIEVTTILGNIVNSALGIMGGLVLLMIVWGGFTWLTGMGNPEKIKAGTNTITWAVLGAVVVLGSYFLLNLVLKALSGGL